jgi:deoxyribodipyrimidine photolyase-related protein
MKAFLVFPHQLFKQLSNIEKDCAIVITEDPLFFGDWTYKAKFHKQKLAYHRATLKQYETYLSEKGYTVHYLEYTDNYKSGKKYLLNFFKEKGINEVYTYAVVDYILKLRLEKYIGQEGVELSFIQSPMFMSDESLFDDVFAKKKTYLMASFYSEQRKRLKILIDENNNPTGGKWSFDDENRKKLPKDISLPKVEHPKQNEIKKEAINYINKHFSDNYGELNEVLYSISFNEAKQWLDNFLLQRFKLFGDYEDAIAAKEDWLFHSVLTPKLNIGLLTPKQVIDEALKYGEENNIPMNSLEGFVRQVIGWREYMYFIYEKEGVYMRTKNFWNFTQKLPDSFYTAETGITPVDTTIKKLNKTAYNHHIERLMILGNFMLLCEFNPDEVYKWFMEMYIDAYDWVMVPNVYGMSQYADGGLICTKPYISGSAYVLKMSDYKKGEWCEVWDGLYWRFIFKHQDTIKKNRRMSMMVAMVNKMDKQKLERHINIAEEYLEKLYNNKANKSKHLLV